MRTLLRRHWPMVVVLVLLVAGGAAYGTSSRVRDLTQRVWHATLVWTGIGGDSVDSDKVFWCPMHPQIKSNKENAVCPICNMALVELEGGTVEAPQHLTLTVQQVQQAGVATEPVMRRKLYREIDTTGRIDYDERRYSGISSWVTGKSRIDKLHVTFTGERVQKGQLVTEIYSPDLIAAQEEFLIAMESAKERGGRTTGRSPLGLAPEVLVDSARQKLLYQGMTPEQVDQLAERQKIWDRIPVHTPISGTVIERHVQEGQYVNEGDWLFHLADLSHLWLFVDIYEDEYPLVEVGTPVEVSVSNQPGKRFSGKVSYIEPKVRPQTRTVPVRIDIDNGEGDLLPGMFARARLRREFPRALAVPESAVLWSGKRAVVIVQHGEDKFRPQEVMLGNKWLYSESKDKVSSSYLGLGNDAASYHEVLAGLAPGDIVVTSGAFLLNAESQFKQVLAKMLPPAMESVTLEEALGEAVAADMRGVLETYFDLVAVLVRDELDAVPEQIEALAHRVEALRQSAKEDRWEMLSKDAALLGTALDKYRTQPAVDLTAARRQFGDISHKLATLLSHHGGNHLMGKELFFFHCGMAKVGYERWLWRSPQKYNPYMGSKRDDGRMIDCGRELDDLEP